jgi:hypothetical protein
VHAIDVFVVVSGTFSIVATVPLMYLAFRSSREAQELHLLQIEVAELMEEVQGRVLNAAPVRPYCPDR